MMRILALLPLYAPVSALAADAPGASAGSLLQVLFGLIAVLALMVGVAWMMRRMGVAGMQSNSVARVIGGVAVGTRERVVVVEVADQWIVVGVAPGRVNALQTLPRREIVQPSQNPSDAATFSSWLKQTMEKRNAR